MAQNRVPEMESAKGPQRREASVAAGTGLWRRAAEILAQLFTASPPPHHVRPANDRTIERRHHERRAHSEPCRLDGFAPALGTPRVLLIEPHDDTRLLYACLFEEVGYAVYGVSDGIAAIRVAQQRLPDVIVMEMAVPGADGLEILRRLREHDLTSSIPAIVVTSLIHFDVPARTRASGAVLVLEKPTRPETLLAAVGEFLAGTPRDRAVVRQLRRTLLTLRELGTRFKADESAQERVRGLIDRLQVAILVLDEQGRYVAVSRGVTTLTGYSRAELLSNSDGGLVSDLLLSGPWQELTTQQSAAETTIRNKNGNIVNIQTAFTTLLPGLHAAAFASSEHAAKS